MSNKNIESCNKLFKLVEEMEIRLQDEPVILDTEELLFQELEKTSTAVEELALLANQSDDFTQLLVSKNLTTIREKIKSLYGRIHNLAVEGEFMLLRVEALLLGKALMKGNHENVVGQLDELKSHLVILKHNFRSSLRNQIVQNTAEKFLASAPGIEHDDTGMRTAAVRALEGKMQAFSKGELFDDEALGMIAEILEEADERAPDQRRLYIEKEIRCAFATEPLLLEALLAMDL